MLSIHRNEWLTKCKITLLGCSPTYLPVSICYGKMPALKCLKIEPSHLCIFRSTLSSHFTWALWVLYFLSLGTRLMSALQTPSWQSLSLLCFRQIDYGFYYIPEGIMFLSCPSVQFFFDSTTPPPLKPLNKIS